MTLPGDLEVREVDIDSIVIGTRRRQKLGRLERLQFSISLRGLIHPILLRNGRELVAGGRRLEACKRLGWKTIPARLVDGLSDEELRAIELEENTERLELADYESSKQRTAELQLIEARQKAATATEETEEAINAPARRENSPRRHRATGEKKGRPKDSKQPGSRRSVAEESGTPDSTRRRLERHVELAERYPFLRRANWTPYKVVEAGDVLEKLPERERDGFAALLDQDALPAKDVIQYLRNALAMPADYRREILTKARSDDEFERRTALTMIAKLPPPVDPGLTLLQDAVTALRKAAKHCHSERFQPKLALLAEQAEMLLKEFDEVNADERKEIWAATG